jgi:hypothetical protein
MTVKSRLHLATAVAAVVAVSPASAHRFRPDDPVRVDPDTLAIPKPGTIELSTTYDVLEHTLGKHPRRPIPPAANANTLGEVPDSSWFTNRPVLTVEQLVRGPNSVDGPDMSRPLTVTRGKSQGITPGFTVKDARGDTYFVKFDPVQYPNLSSAADVISTKFFYAFGYNVPENYIAHFRRDQIVIAPDAMLQRGPRMKRKLTREDVDEILQNVPGLPDGRIRAMFSRRLAGEPVGPRTFWGVRGDDPNDIFPHQDRRDLRGLRVFCAWLNHDDSRSINSLDMYVTDGDRRYLKHYLIDFSSTLGSGSDALRRISPQNPRAGNEYVFEAGPTLKAGLSFGLWERPWRKVRYDEYPEIGRIEADFFQPERWKPEYPNPAFDSMLADDAFWAAKIVSRFSDEAVRALVHTGEFRDPAAERHLADVLIKRRDKVVHHYFRQLSPLDSFRIAGEALAPVLEFEHLGEKAGLGRVESYEVRWFAYDDEKGALTPIGEPRSTSDRSLPVPPATHPFLMARIRARSTTVPAWNKAVDVYLRTEGGLSVVGIEREVTTPR